MLVCWCVVVVVVVAVVAVVVAEGDKTAWFWGKGAFERLDERLVQRIQC